MLPDVMTYPHELHCNASHYQPMGNPGCTCSMYVRARRAENRIRLALESLKDRQMIEDEVAIVLTGTVEAYQTWIRE